MIEYRLIATDPKSRIDEEEAQGQKHHKLTLDDKGRTIVDEYHTKEGLVAVTKLAYYKVKETELTTKLIYDNENNYLGRICTFFTPPDNYRVQIYDENEQLVKKIEGTFDLE